MRVLGIRKQLFPDRDSSAIGKVPAGLHFFSGELDFFEEQIAVEGLDDRPDVFDHGDDGSGGFLRREGLV